VTGRWKSRVSGSSCPAPTSRHPSVSRRYALALVAQAATSRSFEEFFHSTVPARDKFLSRLFGLFSEDVVRHWCGHPEARYEDLGRPTLRFPSEARGLTLDFTFRDRRTGRSFAGELKCELEWGSYSFLRLSDPAQLSHHRNPAFQKFLSLAKEPGASSVTVSGKPMVVDGAVLVWGATTPAGCEAVKSLFGFVDVLSVEEMLSDLDRWRPVAWSARIQEIGSWCAELVRFLAGRSPPRADI
jgi:hypothetical protein